MDDQKVVTKPESIRTWYDRTTKKARRALVGATAISLLAMTAMWMLADLTTLQKIQTYNGALTVPLIGGLWIFSFIFMFLVPSREASFRAQESLEDGIAFITKAIEEHVKPAAAVWHRVGLQVEKEYPEIRKRVEEAIIDLKRTSARVEKALEDNSSLVVEARPVLQALKRIEDRVEGGLLDDLEDMTQAVKRMSGIPAPSKQPANPAPAVEGGTVPMPPAIPDAPEPDLGAVLTRLQSRKKKDLAPQSSAARGEGNGS